MPRRQLEEIDPGADGFRHACRRRFFFAHRARAARLAKARRSSSVIWEKNALAPAPAALSPPRRPRATAAGFFRFAMVADLTTVA